MLRKKKIPKKNVSFTWSFLPDDGLDDLISILTKEYLEDISIKNFNPEKDESNNAPIFSVEELDNVISSRFELDEEGGDENQIVCAEAALKSYCHELNGVLHKVISFTLSNYKTAEEFGGPMVDVPEVLEEINKHDFTSAFCLVGIENQVIIEGGTTSMLFASFLWEEHWISVPFMVDFSELSKTKVNRFPKPTHSAPKRIQ